MTFKKAVRAYTAGGRRERQPLKTPSVPARIHRGPETIRVSARCDRSRFWNFILHGERYDSISNSAEKTSAESRHSENSTEHISFECK